MRLAIHQNVRNMANYFSHDSNARNSDKLIRLRMKHKAAGYGVYFMILERLREEEGYMSVKDYNMIAFDLREDTSLIKSVVEDFGLFVFTDDGEYFYSESFNARMEKMKTASESRSESGRKGAEKRWGKTKASNADSQEAIGKEDGKTMANAIETDGKTMANAIETDGKTMANAIETDGNKINKYFSSSARAQEENPEEKKKEFFEIFFFRNFTDPHREVDRFIAWNAKKGTDPTRYDAELWNQEDKDSKRFNDRFLSAWKNLYALAKYSGPDGERVADAMLDSRLGMKALNGKWILTCPDIVAAWMNANPEPVTQYLKPLLKNFPLEFKAYRIT